MSLAQPLPGRQALSEGRGATKHCRIALDVTFELLVSRGGAGIDHHHMSSYGSMLAGREQASSSASINPAQLTHGQSISSDVTKDQNFPVPLQVGQQGMLTARTARTGTYRHCSRKRPSGFGVR